MTSLRLQALAITYNLATSNIDPTHSINDGNEEEDDDQIAAVALNNQCFVGFQLCKLFVSQETTHLK